MTKEIWKPIPNTRDYDVSNLGRVRSNDTVLRYRNGKMYKRKGQILKPVHEKAGPVVYLTPKAVGSNAYKERIGILVAKIFIGPRPRNLIVMHKNCDRFDNRLENLKYATWSQVHRMHALNSNKLSREQVLDIYHMRAEGVPRKDVADAMGITIYAVDSIYYHRSFKDVTKHVTV